MVASGCASSAAAIFRIFAGILSIPCAFLVFILVNNLNTSKMLTGWNLNLLGTSISLPSSGSCCENDQRALDKKL